MIIKCLKVNRDAIWSTDFVLATVATTDCTGIIEINVPVLTQLRKNWNIDFDDAGAIGRRYRRQDEIGTPYCITIDFETLDDQAVTIRDRDTMAQERIALDQVEAWLAPKLLGC